MGRIIFIDQDETANYPVRDNPPPPEQTETVSPGIPAPPPAPIWTPANRPPPVSFEPDKISYLSVCLPLYRAALTGDWKTAKGLLESHPEMINQSITRQFETLLHIASSTKHTYFVTELVNLMDAKDLELRNHAGHTALCVAAEGGIVDIAEILLSKNKNLLKLRGERRGSPLRIASTMGHKDMVSYLYSKTNHMDCEDWSVWDQDAVLYNCVDNNIYDVALDILNHHKKRVCKDRYYNPLHILAKKPSEFYGTGKLLIWRLHYNYHNDQNQALKIVRLIWEEVVKLNDSDIWNIIDGPPTIIKQKNIEDPEAGYIDTFAGYNSNILFVAAKLGNTRFILELLRLYPELVWKLDQENRTIFHIAVLYRQESVYNLLFQIGSTMHQIISLKDMNNNNIVHLAAMKPEQNRLLANTGAGLQMQSEVQWFKEVQSMVHPSLREARNSQGQTPQELFTEQHADLVEKGERWMKETLSQCMVVAALIATIMFAAAFTLPGGNNQVTGHPIYRGKRVFILFIITDAISLFTSTAALVMFLDILTARYKEEDFLKLLPTKLNIALLTLLVAVTAMMIAFSSSFFLLYSKGRWVAILVSCLAGVPVYLFCKLQYRLFFDVYRPTFRSRFMFKARKDMFY
ncbi:hypothetical protein DCAR_0310240 [Daucus carota subsp. sativus]|uniref:PGG domain-containing protein n=1 Tax=Daucus carota subsp. sativus TaxID=79200 RepID=A0AAF1AS67_DAUCS|nr:hypothetical protein DCAR_0310240 [Daucus carota subsp. sativus]